MGDAVVLAKQAVLPHQALRGAAHARVYTPGDLISEKWRGFAPGSS